MKNNKPIILMLLYAIALLLILIVCVFVLIGKEKEIEVVTETVTETKTEYIYIEVPKETVDIYAPSDEEVTENVEEYFIKEYEGRIGVFEPDGTLVEMIDVYTKTLPEADKQLLKEGFTVIGKRSLASLKEDYSE